MYTNIQTHAHTTYVYIYTWSTAGEIYVVQHPHVSNTLATH